MEHGLSWIVPKRIILMSPGESTTDADLLEDDRAVLNMLDEGDADAPYIHFIVVLNDNAGRVNLKSLVSMTWPKHPRSGWLVVVGGRMNPLLRAVGGLAAQITKIKVERSETVEEALALLYRLDRTLPEKSR